VVIADSESAAGEAEVIRVVPDKGVESAAPDSAAGDGEVSGRPVPPAMVLVLVLTMRDVVIPVSMLVMPPLTWVRVYGQTVVEVSMISVVKTVDAAPSAPSAPGVGTPAPPAVLVELAI